MLRFLHQLFIQHLADSKDPKPLNKWCIFTRTCGELLRLHTDDQLKQLVGQPLQRQKDLHVISLNSSISSTAECDQIISAFAKHPTEKILICIADMKICTAIQVNYMRNAIDNCTFTITVHVTLDVQNANKLAIVVMHFPPEMNMLSRPCYHAVFLNKWDFICIQRYHELLTFLDIDSLGITTGINEEDDSQVHNIEVDSRAWVAKGTLKTHNKNRTK